MDTPPSSIPHSSVSADKKRWNAFICQDCRAIFRIPSDYAGTGVVCPQCDRMLRLPKPGESIPSLVQASEQPVADAHPEVSKSSTSTSNRPEKNVVEMTHVGTGSSPTTPTNLPEPIESAGEWRRRKKHRSRGRNAENEWQRADQRILRFTRRVPLPLIWGAVVLMLICIILIGASLLKKPQDEGFATNSDVGVPMQIIDATQARDNSAAMMQLSQIQDAHEVIERFFRVVTIEELLPILRPVDGLEDKVRRYYRIHPLPDETFDSIDKQSSALYEDRQCFETQIRIKNQPARLMTLMKIDERFRIDWESWVGWSEMNVTTLREKKPLTPVEVRVTLEKESYYNYDFPSALESRWQSYKLTFADDGQILHAYVERASPIHQQIAPPSDVPLRPLILRIRYQNEESHPSQVLIDSVVSEGWVRNLPKN